MTTDDKMELARRIAKHAAPFLCDMAIENCGSVIILRVVTDRAVAWVEEKIQRGDYAPYWPSLVCESRYAQEIIDAARRDGLVVK